VIKLRKTYKISLAPTFPPFSQSLVFRFPFSPNTPDKHAPTPPHLPSKVTTTTMGNKPVDIFWGLMGPPILLLLAASYVPRTILNLVLAGQFRSIISPTLFKEAWFANFWGFMGPSSREGATPRAGPLMARAFGVVLDIGPGSG
jgi:hypothetical protein